MEFLLVNAESKWDLINGLTYDPEDLLKQELTHAPVMEVLMLYCYRDRKGNQVLVFGKNDAEASGFLEGRDAPVVWPLNLQWSIPVFPGSYKVEGESEEEPEGGSEPATPGQLNDLKMIISAYVGFMYQLGGEDNVSVRRRMAFAKKLSDMIDAHTLEVIFKEE